MSRFTKILLALTVANFVMALLVLTDTVDASNVPSLYGTFPVGVTCLGMFLISLRLQKEMAVFDTEQSEKTKHNKVIPLNPSTSPDGQDRHQSNWDCAA